MKRNNFLFITIIILSSMGLASKTEIQPVWQKIPSSIDESGITSLLIFPAENSSAILAGTEQAVYRSIDAGKTFRPVLQLPSSEKRINYLYMSQCHCERNEVERSNLLTPKEIASSQKALLAMTQRETKSFSDCIATIFASTNSGLFISSDRGLRWEKIFSSADPLARHCLSVVTDRDTIYVGTEDGLFYQKSGESSWQKRIDFLNADSTDKAVSFLEKDQQFIYVSTNHELFRIDKDRGSIQKIFSLANREEETKIEIPTEPAESSYASQIKQIKISNEENPELEGSILTGFAQNSVILRPKAEESHRRSTWDSSALSGLQNDDNSLKAVSLTSAIYLVTTKGIFKSLDQGGTWTNLNSDELPLKDIKSLVVLPDQEIWAATLKGVFRYQKERWLPFYKGMETNRVNFLTLDQDGRIYAATDQGIFFMNEKKAFAEDGRSDPNSSKNYFQHEPSIKEVHQMAIRYAEVSPQKIAGWRNAARKRGLMPKLSTGVNRSATDMFHWDTGPNPDVLTKGRDFLDWSVSFSWDFGDLIWNPDQTSIDSRSKLMVELREDILDQITRLYFERRRIQLELAELESNQSSESPGRRVELEKEMRIEELTALIDALTGGEFSRRIQGEATLPFPPLY